MLFSDASNNISKVKKNIKFLDKNEILNQIYNSNIIIWLKRTVFYYGLTNWILILLLICKNIEFVMECYLLWYTLLWFSFFSTKNMETSQILV